MDKESKTISRRKCLTLKRGQGLLNSIINKLPIELHIPSYQFCGPGTKLEKRLARGDQGINKLDEACKEHDISYSKANDLENRHRADNLLLEKAKERLKSSDSSFGEKAASLGVVAAMKTKLKLGMGCELNKKRVKKRGNKSKAKKTITFADLRKKARLALKNKNFKNIHDAVQVAVKATKLLKGPKSTKLARVVQIPKSGGFLPLIPIFAALGALGSLAGGAATIAKTVNEAKTVKQQLEENKRHNQAMESVALGKPGSGLYMKPYKKGLGLFLSPAKVQKNYR